MKKRFILENENTRLEKNWNYRLTLFRQKLEKDSNQPILPLPGSNQAFIDYEAT